MLEYHSYDDADAALSVLLEHFEEYVALESTVMQAEGQQEENVHMLMKVPNLETDCFNTELQLSTDNHIDAPLIIEKEMTEQTSPKCLNESDANVTNQLDQPVDIVSGASFSPFST